METENRLVRLRLEKGLSQSEVAEALGVSRQTVSKWEHGVALPYAENLRRMSEVYDIPIRELMALLSPQNPTTVPPPQDAETSEVLLEPEADTETDTETDAEAEPERPVPELKADAEPDTNAEPEFPAAKPETDAEPAATPPKQRRRWSRRKKVTTIVIVVVFIICFIMAWKYHAASKSENVVRFDEMEKVDVNDLIITFGEFD